MGVDGLHSGLQNEVHRRTQTSQSVAVEGTRLQVLRVLLRLLLLKGTHPRTSGEQRPKLHPGSHAQPAGTLRPHQPLMAGKGQQMDPHLLHGNGGAPRRLGSVQQENKAVLLGKGGHAHHIQEIARQVRGVGAHQQFCTGVQEPLQLVILQPSLPVCRQVIHLYPSFFCKGVEGPQHRVVIPVGGDDVVTRV